MFQLEVGGGKTVQVNEPTRTMFPANLGGAVQYSFANGIYKILEIMGGSLGSFAAGFLVKFLDIIEPTLIEYLDPLLDLLLQQPALPDEMKKLLLQLKAPTSAAAAALLTGLGTQAAGIVAGSVLGTLLAPVTYGLNQVVRPARPSPAEIFAAYWRNTIQIGDVNLWLKETGWSNSMIQAFPEILRPRVDVESLQEATRRGIILPTDLSVELARRGFTGLNTETIEETVWHSLSEQELFTAFWRGKIGRDRFTQGLHALGHKPSDDGLIESIKKPIPGPADLVRMAVREAFSPEVYGKYGYHLDFPPDFAKYMSYWGYDEFWAKAFWAAKWELPSVQLGYEMFHRRIIDKDGLELLLRVADYPSFWRDKMIQASYSPYTRVDTRRMYGLGVLDREAVYWCYRDIGYDDEHAKNLTEFTVRYEDENGADKRVQYHSITQSILEQAYRKDLISLDYAKTRLAKLGYTPEDVNVITSLMDAKKTVDAIPDWGSEHSRDFKTLVEKAYTKRLITKSEAIESLGAIGVSERVTEFILAIADYNYIAGQTDNAIKTIGDAYVSRAIDRSTAVAQFGQLGLPGALQEQHFDEWDMARNLRSRRLTEAQYRKAWGMNIISQDEYIEALRGLGYPDTDINVLVKMALG